MEKIQGGDETPLRVKKIQAGDETPLRVKKIQAGDETPLRVEKMSVAYGDAPPILENISFEIKAGEIFGILGGSGSGKSSVLKNLIGLHRPRRGRVFIFGEDLWADDGARLNEHRRKFGMMYQAGALFGSLNLLENVAMPMLEFTRMPREAIIMAARIKLSLVGLSGYELYLPAHLSGGMQKRAAIARAMSLEPRLIFLDEPGAGLDPITSAGLDKLILALARDLGLAFGVVTHELGSIMNIVDRAIVLEKSARGIVAEGAPKDLAEAGGNPYVTAFFRRQTIQGK